MNKDKIKKKKIDKAEPKNKDNLVEIEEGDLDNVGGGYYGGGYYGGGYSNTSWAACNQGWGTWV